MRIAVQVGVSGLIGLLMFGLIGWATVLTFAAGTLGGFLMMSVPVLVAFACVGLAVHDAAWYLRLAWGLGVGVLGIIGTQFVFVLDTDIDPKELGAVGAGLAHAVAAALLARNWWWRGAGAVMLAATLVLAPSAAWSDFFHGWARLA